MPNFFALLQRIVQRSTKVSDTEPSLDQEAPHVLVPGREAEFIVAALKKKTSAILIHGRAGTGKTTLIKKVVEQSNLEHVIVAPTGVAALNARGQTIHSFFGIPPHIVNLEDIKPSRRLREILPKIELLIIDEISMVRADLLDVIDRTLQVNRSTRKPFGGIPVLMVGDFLQLPPIVSEEDRDILARKGYEVHYAFGAKSFARVKPLIIELEKVHRQSEADFIDLLGRVRVGQDVVEVAERLNERCHGAHRSGNKPVILAATNAAADEYNRDGMLGIKKPSRIYKGYLKDDFRRDRLPAPLELELKPDARVMLVKNDSSNERRWVNGSLGTVSRISDKGIWVRLDSDKCEYQIDIVTWENVKYEWSDRHKKVEQKVVGSYSQYPLKLAWAITIHKSQGLTLNDVRIDLGAGAFSPGQTYVALSRATSLNGLSFASPLSPDDIKVDLDLVDGVSKFC